MSRGRRGVAFCVVNILVTRPGKSSDLRKLLSFLFVIPWRSQSVTTSLQGIGFHG